MVLTEYVPNTAFREKYTSWYSWDRKLEVSATYKTH